jgi:hypothetical protein
MAAIDKFQIYLIQRDFVHETILLIQRDNLQKEIPLTQRDNIQKEINSLLSQTYLAKKKAAPKRIYRLGQPLSST